MSVCMYVCLHGLHGHVAKLPGHFEIQKNSSVTPTKNAYLKIFIFRNTRNMSEVANRWVLKYEKKSGGCFGVRWMLKKSVRPKMTFWAKNPKMKIRATGCTPRVSETPAKAPRPLKSSQTPFHTLNHALSPNKPSVSGLVTACWRAYTTYSLSPSCFEQF